MNSISKHAAEGESAQRNVGGRPSTITPQALEVAARIKSRRVELGLQRVDVSTAVGIKRTELAYLEVQCGARAQEKYLASLAKALVVSEIWLLTGEGDQPEPPVRVERKAKVMVAATADDQNVDAHKGVELRKLLGERAKKRRNAIRMKLKDCAALVGVAGPAMSFMESCLSNATNLELENRWEDALKVPRGWLRNPEIHEPDLPLQLSIGGDEIEAGSDRRASSPQSMELRVMLAARAKERRLALRKRVSAICEAIGKNKPSFAKNEICLRKFPDESTEALWERELEVPAGWLRDPEMETPEILAVSAKPNPIEPSPDVTWTTVSAEIRAIAAWLSRKPKLRKTTDWSQLTQTEKKWAEIFAIRYGVNGAEAATLEAGGQRVGLTRERVRQIVDKMASRAAQLAVPSQQFDLLQLEVMKLAPASTSEIEKTLRGFLGEQLGLADAQRFAAEILAKKVATFSTSPWNINKASKDFVLLRDKVEDEPLLRSTRSVCMGMIRACGAANIYHVCGVVGQEVDHPVALKDVIQTARRVAGFEWLSEMHGWFWFGEDVSDNRLLNVTRKVMAAAQRKVDVGEIHAAMGRSQRFLSHKKDINNFLVEVPAHILTKVLQRVSWLTCIQKNDFMVCNEDAITDCLSDVEKAALTVIRSNDGVALKYEIDMHVKSELGVTDIGIAMALGKSPCFVQPARGLYSVCGCDISYQAMEKATLFSDGLSNSGTSGFPDADGWYKFQFELSEYHSKHKIIGLPILLAKRVSPGNYKINGRDETVQVVARNSGLTLLSKAMPIIQTLKAKAGDQLTFEIDPTRMLAKLFKRK
jgi:transcriptional regulator with XRE-family HTH domain